MLSRVFRIAFAAMIAASTAIAAASVAQERSVGSYRFTEHIRKELAKLPYYGVFDNLAFELKGDTVILYGQVVRAVTRSDAERRIRKIEGVERVINRIEVLPPSPADDSIRRRVYRAVFRTGGLYRYALGANPSIHIVVNRGHVTLEGVVSTRADSQLAYMAANGVSGVFSVTNNLKIERES